MIPTLDPADRFLELLVGVFLSDLSAHTQDKYTYNVKKDITV